MLGLQDVMSGFNLEQKKNQLEIMEIRQNADREGRDLSQSEINRIKQSIPVSVRYLISLMLIILTRKLKA